MVKIIILAGEKDKKDQTENWTDWAEIFCGHSWVAGGAIG